MQAHTSGRNKVKRSQKMTTTYYHHDRAAG
jgi:hypothetical protein